MILSIESSCDVSSIAITKIDTKKLIFHKKISQEIWHNQYGGVVPELASRLHLEALPKILEETTQYFDKLKAIAVTTHPGLSVTLVEGVSMAKALSIALDLPLLEINHLYGHIYSLFIEQEAKLPIIVLLVSGGHTQLLEVKALDNIKLIAQTIDDSFGESFDKVAKMLGLGYPGGPIVEKYALQGNLTKYNFPIPLKQSPKIQFSYSGLKNAVRLAILNEKNLDTQTISNICASFQYSAVEHIVMKLKKYFKQPNTQHFQYFAIVGGASANLYLREKIENLCNQYGIKLLLSKLQYCSDNAAMIGRVGIEYLGNKKWNKMN